MHKKVIILFWTILLILCLKTNVKANSEAINNNVKTYKTIIEDDAELLSDDEETKLKEQMEHLTEFGNVVFKTTKIENNTRPLSYIQNYYYSILQNKPGVAFYIDMKSREICLCATGGLEKTITSYKCDTIMDNVYLLAKKGEYYKCAESTFQQVDKLLNGEKIAEKMKYYCNAILAMMLSLFATYGIYTFYSKLSNKRASDIELIGESTVSLDHTPIEVRKTGSHSVYSPASSGSSGGGSSGGGSSGGGFSGSGGSHGF